MNIVGGVFLGILGVRTETYLYINGIVFNEEIKINDSKMLLPASCELPFGIISKAIKSDIDYSIAVLFGKSIDSQMRIIANNPKELAISAWNAQWDIMLLSAIFNCSADCNLQCTDSVYSITDTSILTITNYHVHSLGLSPYITNGSDVKWLKEHFINAQALLDDERFSTAVHSLASYKWHSLPRVQLAVLWMGIESLFKVDSELVFRISLYVAKFLEGNDDAKARDVFNDVKRLYKARSSAVHGGKLKGDLPSIVAQSSLLLNKLIKRCAEKNELPNVDKLAF